MEAISKAVKELEPVDRFTYDFGRFVLDWNSFQFYIDALVWHIRTEFLNEKISCYNNFREMRQLQSWEKRKVFLSYLRRIGRQEVMKAAKEVYEIAERNEWIHGVVIHFTGLESGIITIRMN